MKSVSTAFHISVDFLKLYEGFDDAIGKWEFKKFPVVKKPGSDAKTDEFGDKIIAARTQFGSWQSQLTNVSSHDLSWVKEELRTDVASAFADLDKTGKKLEEASIVMASLSLTSMLVTGETEGWAKVLNWCTHTLKLSVIQLPKALRERFPESTATAKKARKIDELASPAPTSTTAGPAQSTASTTSSSTTLPRKLRRIGPSRPKAEANATA